MKIALLSVALGAASIMVAATVSFNSDPFGARVIAHKITAFNPSIAYAASDTIVDGYHAASQTQVSWGVPASGQDANSENPEMVILCKNPSDALISHERFDEWCP